MSWFWRYALPTLGIAFCLGVFFGLTLVEKLYVLPSFVTPSGQEMLSDWLDEFQTAEIWWVLVPSAGLTVLWCLISIFGASYRGDHRLVWYILWASGLCAAVLCILFVCPAEANRSGIGLVPAIVILLNGAALFWLATAPFSTITHKFAPLGGKSIRKIW